MNGQAGNNERPQEGKNDKPQPCPFCGAKPTIGKGQRRKVSSLYEEAGAWMWKPSIGCAKCNFRREFETVYAALLWWNTRTTKGQTATAAPVTQSDAA